MSMSARKINEETELQPQLRSRPLAATFIMVGGVITLILSIFLAISYGAADVKMSVIWDVIFHFNPDFNDHQVIRDLRLPRILGAVLVGASFATAGAIMQGMTRNPLADSGLLGLNSGAVLAMAINFAFFPNLPYYALILFSFIGASVSTGLVYGIGSISRGGLTPLRLVLSGTVISALFSALSEGVALHFRIGQDLAFWYAGGVAGTTWTQIKVMVPIVFLAILGAIIISRSVTLLSLGEEIATGLGQKAKTVKIFGTVIVLILAGSAVSVVGAVGFVGLIVPHLTRYLVGVDYRFIIPCSAILGALLLVWADFAARMINAPYETPVGALIALIGVPFFLYLARKERREL
ncbi:MULTISPECIES: FecCD family ABC transporter permease [Bacillus]|uniref:FecCD family ABC transporter permease n=1 Tax=Bacillus TaxID=1386 RepID=UPI000E2F0C9D|nr:iron ABC transporter permease [Bacillus cereus]RFB22583.1 iron ABC transporter permease [Bacillus sp. LB(2018)]HDR6299798.1 iron ABC transporter permease [Bacillus cereus]HDR8171184.1 iron ABC transporter permease [Bacillus thuringiensis]